MDKTQRRKDGLRFKLLPDGHIRAYNAFTSDKRGISEMQIYPPVLRSGCNNLPAYADNSLQ